MADDLHSSRGQQPGRDPELGVVEWSVPGLWSASGDGRTPDLWAVPDEVAQPASGPIDMAGAGVTETGLTENGLPENGLAEALETGTGATRLGESSVDASDEPDASAEPGSGPEPDSGPEPEAPLASVTEIRSAVAVATAAVAGLRSVLWQAPGGALAEILGELGELALLTDAAEVALVCETLTRGEHSSGPAPLAINDWVSVHSRRYPTPVTAAKTVELAQHIIKRELPERLTESVLTAAAPVPAAAAAAAEMLRLEPDLQPGFVPAGWDAYTDLAETGDVSQVRKLRPALIAKYGQPDDKDKDERAARAHRCLTRGATDGGSLIDYRLRLDPEAAAVLERALGPLSTPIPRPDGQPDDRSYGARRADALIELITRAVKAADTSVVGRTSTHTTVIVTLDDLASGAGTGQSTGACDAGRFLSIATVRAMSCGGHVTPVVVDHYGNPILVGRTKRLVTPAQCHALAARDNGCTFPGCTRPADWSDAHHLIHWVDGGATDLDNAALLCRLHHTIVHSRRLAGRVGAGPPGTPDQHRLRVIWDLTPGSYDRAVAARTTGPPAA